MNRSLFFAALGISSFAIPSAFGADGYVTGNVNLRAGPDSSYPSVAMLPEGDAVSIEGCVDGWSWCDVAAGNNRGWVAGNFLQEEYQGQRVLVPQYAVQIGIPVVSFVFGTYWDNYYRNRSWYGNRERWSHVTPQYRPMGGHDDRRADAYDNANAHGHGVSADASRAGTEPRQTAVAVAHASRQERLSKPTASQHPVATQASRSGSYANHAKTDPHAVEARAPTAHTATVHQAPQRAVVAVHKTTAPAAARKQTPEKDAPEKKDNNGKDEH